MDPEYGNTVQIHAGVHTGTGVLFFPPDSSVIYVLTARHVIYGNNENPGTAPVEISLQNVTHPSLAGDHFELPSSTRIIQSANPEHDLAILVVEAALFGVSAPPSNPPAIHSDYGLETCLIIGFPDYGNGEIRKINCSFEGYPRSTPDRFLVRSSFALSDTHNDSADNARGVSGAGLFLHYELQSYLVGIITDYTRIDSFYGTGIRTINDLLSSSSLEMIPTVDLVVDPDIKAIRQNNRAVEARIKSNIGTVHVPRTALKDTLLPFRSNQFFVVHGNAGAGKSAFARDLVADLRNEYEVFLFTGEQFARDSLELVLQQLPSPITTPVNRLLTAPAFRDKKLFWIESAEKLVETGQLNAFIELLDRVKGNPDFKL